jgi:hypothetical protein
MFIEQIEKSKKENDVKNIMENNIIALRKIKKLQKSITTIKEMNNNLINLSSKEKKYLISSFSLKLSFEFIDYWNKNENKKNLFINCLKDEKREIQSKYLIDKINLIKFILLQFHQIINDDMNNNNFECTKYIFDIEIINQLIIILYEYTINSINSKIIEYEDEEIIIFNICRILIKLTNLSSYFSFLILQNDMNLQLIFSSMKDFFKKNQCISCNLLLLIYNLYADDEDTILLKCDKLIPFILEALYNYQINPKENIILPNFLFNLLEFLTKLLNEKTFNKFFNDQKINNCILLTINIYKNYDDISIKKSSLKCLLCLFHCINGDYEIKIDKKSFIKTFLPNLNIELNSPYLVINILEIISYMSFLYEIDDFSTDELIDEINQILISFVFHKEQIKMYYDKNEINIIIENISVILLNFCLSSKVAEYMTKNTTIMKNIILILNNYSLDMNIIQNLYNFIKDFMDNIDNFVHLIICNYLEIGIIKNLEKYLFNKKYEIILIILNHTYKSLEFGNINQNNLNINFVQSYLDKKGFNDILNIIISPDFGNLECSSLAKAIQQDYFK